MSGRRFRIAIIVVTVGVMMPSGLHSAQQPLTADMVREAIDRGVQYLQKKQDRQNGTWPEKADYEGGVTSLCTLALLNAGVPPEDPSIQLALAYLRSLGRPSKTYCVALQTMVFCIAEPRKDMSLIQRNAAWLEHAQVKKGPFNGTWSYSDAAAGGDKSNAQFALLALHEAERLGVKVEETTWRRAENYWHAQQNQDGSWEYRNQGSSGSMTCAGIASLAITAGRLSKGDATVEGQTAMCCGPQQDNEPMERGLDWLGRNFSVSRNPNSQRAFRDGWLLYYLYALERVGRLTGRRFIGDHDWYREGAEFLLSRQDPLTGSWRGTLFDERRRDIATAFSLLFLSKGKRPILICKLKRRPDNDWNRHRSDLAHLTRYVESRWQKDMNWQVIDVRAASPRDLHQTPVLFINGRDGLEFTDEEKAKLREYTDNGGFIFAEACCEGTEFDRQFRALMAELFENNPLRLLPPEHPVWYAEEKVDPDFMRPLWGIDACCRTSVVYCPEDLSCYWELAAASRGQEYPPRVKDKIQAALSIGVNVLTYATSRELKEKLELDPLLAEMKSSVKPSRSSLRVAKLYHGSGSDDAPAALTRLLQMIETHFELPISYEWSLDPPISATEQSLPDFPILFMHGRRTFRWSEAEREALAKYLNAGGFLFVNSICANEAFSRSFRDEMRAIFPATPLRRIPPGHPMLSGTFHGYDVNMVQVREPFQRPAEDAPLRARLRKVTPLLEGIELDGKVAVVFSPLDVSCALENYGSLQCHGYTREDAAKIGANVILYALQR